MEYEYQVISSQLIHNVNGEELHLEVLKFQGGFEFSIHSRWQQQLLRNLLILVVLSLCAILFCICYDYINILICLLSIFFVLIQINRMLGTVKEEQVLVVKSVGIQLQETYLLGSNHSFIPWDDIEAIFINEVIVMQRILFMLTILCKKGRLYPVFHETQPRLDALKYVYKLIKSL